ncbi:hypothetical protein HMPREF1548_03135 [Clostridium sp. KLE 1755]|nr:hypothetical protein HMPREF1548_03135 [Clostridium sp. KLE 1755]
MAYAVYMFHYTCFQEDVNREMIIVTISDLCNGGAIPTAAGGVGCG